MGPPGDTLAMRWKAVRERIDAACRACDRDPAGVAILPVSKTHGPEVIGQALALGMRRFGENRVQEIRDKAAALEGRGIEWVLIGPLQTNKAKYVARLVAEVQSLDRIELAEALDARLEREDRVLDVLVQVKTSPKPAKHGLAPGELIGFLGRLRAFPRLRVHGLMTMAVQSDDAQAVRACFARLRTLRDSARAEGFDLPRLSMGMSGDFELAIAEGSTEVRIGSALFGARVDQG